MPRIGPATLIEADTVSGTPGSRRLVGAEAALTGFYRAFNRRDLAALEANWAPGELASM